MNKKKTKEEKKNFQITKKDKKKEKKKKTSSVKNNNKELESLRKRMQWKGLWLWYHVRCHETTIAIDKNLYQKEKNFIYYLIHLLNEYIGKPIYKLGQQ